MGHAQQTRSATRVRYMSSISVSSVTASSPATPAPGAQRWAAVAHSGGVSDTAIGSVLVGLRLPGELFRRRLHAVQALVERDRIVGGPAAASRGGVELRRDFSSIASEG